MSAATTALDDGLTALLADLGVAFSYGGTAFTALVDNPASRGNELDRPYNYGAEFDVVLAVDADATAFSGGLPAKGARITHTATGKILVVDSVSLPPGGHGALINCRKPV